jgi:hypothetical protein
LLISSHSIFEHSEVLCLTHGLPRVYVAFNDRHKVPAMFTELYFGYKVIHAVFWWIIRQIGYLLFMPFFLYGCWVSEYRWWFVAYFAICISLGLLVQRLLIRIIRGPKPKKVKPVPPPATDPWFGRPSAFE